MEINSQKLESLHTKLYDTQNEKCDAEKNVLKKDIEYLEKEKGQLAKLPKDNDSERILINKKNQTIPSIIHSVSENKTADNKTIIIENKNLEDFDTPEKIVEEEKNNLQKQLNLKTEEIKNLQSEIDNKKIEYDFKDTDYKNKIKDLESKLSEKKEEIDSRKQQIIQEKKTMKKN
jgi:ABC-type proline/glycine betaine transport system ATPase subunit